MAIRRKLITQIPYIFPEDPAILRNYEFQKGDDPVEVRQKAYKAYRESWDLSHLHLDGTETVFHLEAMSDRIKLRCAPYSVVDELQYTLRAVIKKVDNWGFVDSDKGIEIAADPLVFTEEKFGDVSYFFLTEASLSALDLSDDMKTTLFIIAKEIANGTEGN